MSESVYILGAGASAEAGAPLMYNFLDVAEDLMRYDTQCASQECFTSVFRALRELRAVHHKADLDLDNLETVFAAFEMAAMIGRLGNYPRNGVGKLPQAMQDLILATLSHTVKFKAVKNGGSAYLVPPPPYEEFASYLKQAEFPGYNAAYSKAAMITFNYDLCLDFALPKYDIPICYSLEQDGNGKGVHLHKLHGSLNWYWCSKCRTMRPWDVMNVIGGAAYRSSHTSDGEPLEVTLLDLDERRSKAQGKHHCGKPMMGPIIVPPTWSKAHHQARLEKVWKAAAADLREARNIYVFGYSLPDTDQFFRHLYAVGSVGDGRIRRFWVFDPNPDVENKFRSMLGQGAESRFHFFPVSFRKAVYILRRYGEDAPKRWQESEGF